MKRKPLINKFHSRVSNLDNSALFSPSLLFKKAKLTVFVIAAIHSLFFRSMKASDRNDEGGNKVLLIYLRED